MRRRAVLAGIAGAAATLLAQQLQVLARPIDTDDDTTPSTPPPQQPPDTQPATPSAPAAAPAKPATAKPDLSDPKYSPNAYSPAKTILDGQPKSGEFALTADDLNLRANPAYNGEVLTIIPGGSQITVEGKVKDGFFPINFKSGLGWADGKFLQRLG